MDGFPALIEMFVKQNYGIPGAQAVVLWSAKTPVRTSSKCFQISLFPPADENQNATPQHHPHHPHTYAHTTPPTGLTSFSNVLKKSSL
jgi:hypothetical protein